MAWRGNPGLQGRHCVLLDFETTGLGSRDRVIEIAALRVAGGREEEFHRLCNPGVPLPRFIQELTGLTDSALATAPPTAQAIRELYETVLHDQPLLVAHNVAFDRRFQDQELRRAKLPPFHGDVICTMALSFQLYPYLPSHRLPDLVHHLRIPVARHHRALDDVRATRRVLEILLQVAARKGIDPVNNLARQPGW